jgi:hypothetical protein
MVTERKNGDLSGNWTFAGIIGVDGAHLLVADANYAEEFSKEWKSRTRHDYDATVIDGVANLRSMGDAFACVAGDGDGCYRVFIRRGKTELEGCDDDIITGVFIDLSDGEAYDDAYSTIPRFEENSQ